MNLKHSLLPEKSRDFTGKRWLNIGLRTLHLIGIAGVGGGFLYQASREFWLPYLVLTVISGLSLVVLEVYSNGIWLIQLRGLATLFKLAILSLAFVVGLKAWLIIPIIIISSIIAHAPGDVRYYSPFYGRRIEHL